MAEPRDEHREEEPVEELLGVYALDAVDDDERRLVDELLRVDPRAAQEVDEHRQTAATLASSATAAPDGLWERIAATLEEPPPAPSGELAKVIPMGGSTRRRRTLLAVIGAVAAALIVVLAVGVARRSTSPATMQAAMEHAADAPESQQLTLRSQDGSVHAQAVLDGEGHGFIAGSTLPSLPSDRTYQLWGVIDGRAISLGVLGHRPDVESFSVDGNLSALLISDEVAGGVPTDANMVGVLSATVS
jgi:anti-sigma factor RsiW